MKKSFFILSFLFLCFGCKKEATEQNYSDLFLDEATLQTFFKNHPESKAIQEEVRLFYEKREYQFAWFNNDGMTEAVPNFYNQLQNYSADFDDDSFKISQLDAKISAIETEENASKIDQKENEQLELLLTTTFFKFSKKAYSGVTKNPHQLDWFIPLKKKNYQALLNSLILKDEDDKTNEPVNKYYKTLRAKLREYRIIQDKGGFPKIVTDKKILAVNDNDSCVLNVKKRLFLSGDLKSNDKTTLFTADLAKAVANFQERLGLPTDGKIDSATLTELNRTVDFRIRQMIINLERLRWLPQEVGDDYLVVNIPEYKLHVFEAKQLVWEANVVVGKEAKRTSIFKGSVSQIVLNPYWNIPNSIINEEILPKLKQDASYLEKNNMELLSGGEVINASRINWSQYSKNVPFEMRQKPGADNSLGRMKFLFPNGFNIYLHDTPAKELFDRNKRDFSHGCIRVENPKRLAVYLLRNDKDWTEDKIDLVLKTTTETKISLKPKVPVYITYFTAWVDHKGNLNFRNDIYNLDDKLAKEVFEK